MPASPPPTLLADIGGTNVRFALFDGAELGEVTRLKVADYQSLADAARSFLRGRKVESAVLAAAGPVEHGRCLLTNHSWIVDGPGLARDLGFATAHVLNDFEAVAWSLPSLAGEDLHSLGGDVTDAEAPMLVMGPGTGLGVSALVPVDRGFRAVASEGGHATLAAGDEREAAVIALLRRRFGHVSAERVLCGAGLENLYGAIASLDGRAVAEPSAAEITSASAHDPIAAAALGMFCSWLGAVAGDLALTFGARGGVYLAGGIAPRILPALEASDFRRRFEAKGRFQAYLAAIPVSVILKADPAFLGLAGVARHYKALQS